jgi:DNA-binding CsgD family transcriptional regulator
VTAAISRRELLSVPSAETSAATALAPMVEVWFQMLCDHVPDANHRCIACTHGGTGARATPWPCSLRSIAEEARRSHADGAMPFPTPRPPMDDAPSQDDPPGEAPVRARRRRRLRGVHGITRVLTPREQEYLQLAADGCADTEIAERLGLPERSVSTALRRLIRTLGVTDRASLLVLALREGVIT